MAKSATQNLVTNQPKIETKLVECCMGDPKTGATLVASGYDFEYETCANLFEFYKANDCDVIFINPQPKAETLSTIYPPNYFPFQFNKMKGIVRIARDFMQRQKAKAILKVVGSTGNILDIGTGSGILLRQLAVILNDKSRLFANDFSAGTLEELKSEGFSILVGQAESLQTDVKFQAITLMQVLEHLENPVKVVQQLKNLLEPGGYLWIELPSIDGLDAKLFKKGYWGGYHIPRHFWLFNEKSLTRLLQEAGLEVVQVQYMASPSFWIQSLHHLFLDRGQTKIAKLFTAKNPVLLAIFTTIDLVTGLLGKPTSNMRMVAKKPN